MSYTDQTVVIIGAGQAGGQCALSLRRNGFDGRIIMVGDEPHPPYQRPPLSKAYLSGEIGEDRLWVQTPQAWDEQKVDMRTGLRALAIDRDGKSVTFDDGSSQAYDHLVFATGSRVRELPVDGADLDGVRYLRNIADVDALKAEVRTGRRIAIIGGGYIGLEAASVASKLGAEPVVIEAMPRLLARVAPEALSSFYLEAHQKRGVQVRLDSQVRRLLGDAGRVRAVELADGTEIACDSALVGIGVLPNIELARDAGIECDNGILVDEKGQTSADGIYAIGDCCNQHNWLAGQRMRLESVPNALEQGKLVAAAICSQPLPRREVPWFWSDQFDLKLQTAGLMQAANGSVIRQGDNPDQITIFHLRDEVLVAADCVNDPQSFMASKMMIMKGAKPSPDDLANTEVLMKDIMKAAQ
ncbi:MAG: FAD-dependent oxidoreductase [Maricaulis sp.]|jgi:3-phenylpropionate/trans-cinnamate dioxygenase ferredoxin reductase subunit|uniref:NAD(P)/FAD-dependent oxidoreductase n=1 Tax=Maricaulis sp. TaxID=1486257 RepID=UPI001B08CBFD|nr:FAD-dependent oxidoreductase [Maricaulis sp.]MBO6728405.1 FAD-dependent oxidoreductase [Maricaulis sp.]MBO6846441.1 FAD-dependent oxidoreductase [Maricaulis sp.]MBO6876672.1 FAD-dependent oxidoreductase [Maricaulis sp.]